MRKFGNTADKIKVILGAFNGKERLKGREIVEKVLAAGYRVDEKNLKMFIYHNMLYKHLQKEPINGVNYYYPLT